MADENQSDNEKVAGKDQSRDFETTQQQAEKQDALPTSAEERGKTDPDADGSSVGAVREGDSNVEDRDRDEDDDYEFDFLDEDREEVGEDQVVGTVPERDRDGNDYDVPYGYLTAENLPRTSDTDDPARDWTAQHAGGEREDEDGNELDPVALVPVQQTPGQTFRLRELPNRDVAEAAGVDYDQWVSGLPVRADVPDEAPRQGLPG